jgi:hypothetical protein
MVPDDMVPDDMVLDDMVVDDMVLDDMVLGDMGRCDSPNMIPPAYLIRLRRIGARIGGAPLKAQLRGRIMWIGVDNG